MNFTIGICLTCSNQLLSQSSPAQTAMIAEGRKEGRKAGRQEASLFSGDTNR